MTAVEQDQLARKFVDQRPRARALFARARAAIAGGVGHDLRYNDVAPTYITHARGSHKWDVDGNEYIDYGMGNAALLLGHAHPAVLDAVQRAVPNGLHFGNDHPEMVDWAELIQARLPKAERVRFTNSGSESAVLALRLARAYSGREKVLRLEGHFSGWHDAVGKGAAPPFQSAVSLGILILINNAGHIVKRVHWTELEPAHLDRVFGLNYRAPLYLTQLLSPAMIARGRGVIINILSTAYVSGGTDTVYAYASAKGALWTLTHALANSLAPRGVRVLAVSPGTVDTGFQREPENRALWQQWVNNIPLKRIGAPSEIGEVVAFLATDAASFIVGETIHVNGGIFMS